MGLDEVGDVLGLSQGSPSAVEGDEKCLGWGVFARVKGLGDPVGSACRNVYVVWLIGLLIDILSTLPAMRVIMLVAIMDLIFIICGQRDIRFGN